MVLFGELSDDGRFGALSALEVDVLLLETFAQFGNVALQLADL